MTNTIGNILSVQVPLQTSTAQSQSGSGSSAQTDPTSDNNQNTTPTAPQSSQNQQTQTNNPAQTNNASGSGSAGSSHFGSLLVNKDQSSAAVKPQTKPANPKSDSSQTDASNNAAAALLVMAQQIPLTQSDANNAQVNVGEDAQTSVVGASGNSQTLDNSLLQQIQQLLQQALAENGTSQASAGNTDTTEQAATTPTTNTDTTGQAATDTNTDTKGQVANNSDTSLTQALDQLIALLQGAGSTSPATLPTTDAPAQTSTPDIALIAQLAKTLEEKLGVGQGAATPTGAGTKPTDNTSIIADAIVQTANIQNPNIVLQSALAQIAGFLSSSHSKSDSVSNDIAGISNSQSASANSVAANAVPLTNAVNQTQGTSSEFVKFLSSASSNAPVADQVLVQIRSQANQGASQIKIQLAPADLGRVTVQMNTGTDGKTGVTITADNRQTLSMLQSEARSLEAALRNIGLKTNSGGLSFNLSGQQSNQQSPGKQSGYTQVASATATDEDADYYSTTVGVYQLAAQQGLDIRV